MAGKVPLGKMRSSPMVEQRTVNATAAGSSPASAAITITDPRDLDTIAVALQLISLSPGTIDRDLKRRAVMLSKRIAKALVEGRANV